LLSSLSALTHNNFIKCPDSALKWEYRSSLILEELLRSEADVFCLEEVDHYHDFYEPELSKHGYEGLFVPKCNSPCLSFPNNNGPDGCALMFRSERFQLVKRKDLVLKNTSGGNSSQVAMLVELCPKEGRSTVDKKYDSAEKESDSDSSSRSKEDWSNELAPAVKEKNASCDESLQDTFSVYIGVAHLKAKPPGAELRKAQGQHLIEEMIAFSKEGSPVIIAGDFNGSPTEPVYRHFTNLEAHPQLPLRSSYGDDGIEPDFTSWKIRSEVESKYTIDYLWYHPDALCLGRIWGLPSSAEIGEAALPCAKYPSDHIALCAEFHLANNAKRP